MLNKIQVIKKPRGHAPEKQERNQAIIALHICGFNTYQIPKLLRMDRRNAIKFVKKYYPKYSPILLENIKKHFLAYKQYI